MTNARTLVAFGRSKMALGGCFVGARLNILRFVGARRHVSDVEDPWPRVRWYEQVLGSKLT